MYVVMETDAASCEVIIVLSGDIWGRTAKGVLAELVSPSCGRAAVLPITLLLDTALLARVESNLVTLQSKLLLLGQTGGTGGASSKNEGGGLHAEQLATLDDVTAKVSLRELQNTQ